MGLHVIGRVSDAKLSSQLQNLRWKPTHNIYMQPYSIFKVVRLFISFGSIEVLMTVHCQILSLDNKTFRGGAFILDILLVRIAGYSMISSISLVESDLDSNSILAKTSELTCYSPPGSSLSANPRDWSVTLGEHHLKKDHWFEQSRRVRHIILHEGYQAEATKATGDQNILNNPPDNDVGESPARFATRATSLPPPPPPLKMPWKCALKMGLRGRSRESLFICVLGA